MYFWFNYQRARSLTSLKWNYVDTTVTIMTRKFQGKCNLMKINLTYIPVDNFDFIWSCTLMSEGDFSANDADYKKIWYVCFINIASYLGISLDICIILLCYHCFIIGNSNFISMQYLGIEFTHIESLIQWDNCTYYFQVFATMVPSICVIVGSLSNSSL